MWLPLNGPKVLFLSSPALVAREEANFAALQTTLFAEAGLAVSCEKVSLPWDAWDLVPVPLPLGADLPAACKRMCK